MMRREPGSRRCHHQLQKHHSFPFHAMTACTSTSTTTVMMRRFVSSVVLSLLLVGSSAPGADAFPTRSLISGIRRDALACTYNRASSCSRTALSMAMTPPIFHMGHSHAHHDHDHSDDADRQWAGMSEKQKAQAVRQRRLRRVALWLFCALATLGPKVIKQYGQQSWTASLASLQKGEWLTFGLSILAISSADKMKRNLEQYWQKLRGLGSAIAKHSSIGQGQTLKTSKAQSTTASTISFLASQQQQLSSLPDTTDADRVTWIGVVINVILSIGKLTVGITQHSSVLIADAGHSFSDLISDFITLWSVQIARLPPDEDHPYGHTKFEAIGSLFLSLTLLATGLSVGAMAHKQLMPFLLNSGTTAAAAAAIVHVPGPLALVMAAISIASKEWLYRITKAVGEKLNSPVVVANAWHHRSDAYSSVLALLSIAAAMSGFAAADAAAGLLVAGMIGLTGCDIMVESIQQLSDSAHLGLQEELQAIVETWVEKDPDVLKITTLRARQVGSSAFCDVTVETSPELSTTATRAVEERLKRYLVPALSERTGHWITATVHAKAPLVVCPLLEATAGNSVPVTTSDATATTEGIEMTATSSEQTSLAASSSASTEEPYLSTATALSPPPPPISTELSSSQVEFRVRQQALLLDPHQEQKYQVQSVTVHYSSPQSVSVDVTIHPVLGSDAAADNDYTLQTAVNLLQLQASAKELQTTLQDQVTEIQSARIYLDLLRGFPTDVPVGGATIVPPSNTATYNRI